MKPIERLTDRQIMDAIDLYEGENRALVLARELRVTLELKPGEELTPNDLHRRLLVLEQRGKIVRFKGPAIEGLREIKWCRNPGAGRPIQERRT